VSASTASRRAAKASGLKLGGKRVVRRGSQTSPFWQQQAITLVQTIL